MDLQDRCLVSPQACGSLMTPSLTSVPLPNILHIQAAFCRAPFSVLLHPVVRGSFPFALWCILQASCAPARGCLDNFAACLTGALLPGARMTVTLLSISCLKDAQARRKCVRKALQAGEGAGFDVETVLIPVVRSQGRRPRTTLCISSQVGCAMNCQFCFTGRMGLK